MVWKCGCVQSVVPLKESFNNARMRRFPNPPRQEALRGRHIATSNWNPTVKSGGMSRRRLHSTRATPYIADNRLRT